MASSEYYIQDNADIENQKLEAAKALYKTGDYQNSLRLYLDMVNSGYSYKLCYEIGRCYYRLEDMDNAELYFTRSINLEEFKNPSYTFLGNICFKKQNLEKAIEYWITSYSYKPDDESVCLNLATTYFSKDMKFYSVYFYGKYLKYAKDKDSSHYQEIKKSIDEFAEIGNSFYKKALRAVSMNDNDTAIQALEYAVNNFPTNFDINNLLGKIYYEKKDYAQAKMYLEQAYCLDSKSIDILKKLSSVMILTGDITGSYCCLKRMLPLVISRQKEYYDIIKTIKELETRVNENDVQKHINMAEKYYKNNNYILALFEYENCVILDTKLSEKYENIIQKIKQFFNPEERIIRTCFEKGALYHSEGNYVKSNKYFTKIMTLADETSSEYKLAKSRIVNVQ
jgi:tetratricopeptide (TPR) repeat protein